MPTLNQLFNAAKKAEAAAQRHANSPDAPRYWREADNATAAYERARNAPALGWNPAKGLDYRVTGSAEFVTSQAPAA